MAEPDELGGLTGDVQHLFPRLLRRGRSVNADDVALATVLGETNDHAGMRGAGDRAHDHVIEAEAERGFLLSHFLGETDITQPTEWMHRSARRDRVGLAALRLDVGDGALPTLADADVEPFVDQLDLGAHHAA